MIGRASHSTTANQSRNILATGKPYERLSCKVGFKSIMCMRFILTQSLIGHPRFFLGSDSAPHPAHTKSVATPTHPCAAGVYTSPILLPFVAQMLESFGALDRLQDFVSNYGRAFYRRPPGANARRIILRKVRGIKVADTWPVGDDRVIPFWADKELEWGISDQ